MKYLICICVLSMFFFSTSLSAFALESKKEMIEEEEELPTACNDGEAIKFDPAGTILPLGCELMVGDWLFTFMGQQSTDQKYCVIYGENVATGDTEEFHINDEEPVELPYELDANRCTPDTIFILEH
ncbi:MAG: hypothetical protein HQM14_10640 [SAR324 cluster bacterium]|nr:hypothetical protein [SAR324 cluster bacterium]